MERIAYRPLRSAPRLIPLISAIGVSFFLQDLIRLFESLWRNSFNLVYPSMDVLNIRFELTGRSTCRSSPSSSSPARC